MEKMIKLTLICIILSISATVAKAQELTEQKKTAVQKEIEAFFNESIKAAENLNVDKLNQSVDDKYKAGFIINDAYYSTFDSLLIVFESGIQGIKNQEIEVQKKKITVLSENIAILTASGKANVNLNSGQTFSTKFAWSFVYEKIGNQWKVIHSHQGSSR